MSDCAIATFLRKHLVMQTLRNNFIKIKRRPNARYWPTQISDKRVDKLGRQTTVYSLIRP